MNINIKGAILIMAFPALALPAQGSDQRLRGRYVESEFVYVWDQPWRNPWLDGTGRPDWSESRDDWFSADMAFALYPQSDADWVSIESPIAYVLEDNGGQKHYFRGGWYTGELDIPATVVGGDTQQSYPVGEVAFDNNGVRRLRIAGENTSVRMNECFLLREIELPEKMTGSLSLSYCPRLEKINLPENMESVYAWEFVNTALSDIALPASLKIVGNWSFNGNYKLKHLDLGCLEVAEIGAFSSNPRLKSVVLPETLVQLGSECFSHLWGLEEVTLPMHEVEMGKDCFVGCPNLERVKVNAPMPYTCPEFVITNGSRLTVYVPEGSLEAYRNAEGWRDVKEIREGDLPMSEVRHIENSKWQVSTGPGCIYIRGLEDGRITVTNLNGMRVAMLEGESHQVVYVDAGLYIVSDGARSCKVIVK